MKRFRLEAHIGRSRWSALILGVYALLVDLKTTKLDAMKLAYEPDILLIAHGRTYPALLCKLGPAVAEAVSFHDSSPPTLSLDEYSHAAVDTAMRMLHFTGSMP